MLAKRFLQLSFALVLFIQPVAASGGEDVLKVKPVLPEVIGKEAEAVSKAFGKPKEVRASTKEEFRRFLKFEYLVPEGVEIWEYAGLKGADPAVSETELFLKDGKVVGYCVKLDRKAKKVPMPVAAVPDVYLGKEPYVERRETGPALYIWDTGERIFEMKLEETEDPDAPQLKVGKLLEFCFLPRKWADEAKKRREAEKKPPFKRSQLNEALKAAYRRNLAQVEFCARKHAGGEIPYGIVKFRMTVSDIGRPVKIEILESEIENKSFLDCLRRFMKGWGFRELRGKGMFTAEFRLKVH